MNTAPVDKFETRRRWGLAGLAAATAAVGLTSLAVGAVDVSAADVTAVLAGKIGIFWPAPAPDLAESVVWGLRMPRLLIGLAVGGALAATGMTLQGVLRNDLADPHLLGVGPGAAIGAAIGAGSGGVQGAIAGGVVAGVLTSFALRRLARTAGADPNRLILSGVALGAALSAWVGFVVFGSDRSVVPPIEFWLLGSLSGATWRGLGTAVVFLVAGVGGIRIMARTLDLLRIGHQEATHIGLDVPLATTIALLVVGVTVGATVGVAGVVVFVGLLVPRLVRPLTGPHHRHLLASSLLGGGLFVVASDLVARLALEPVEIPVGLVTSVVGGPVFLWLVSRQRDV